MAELSGPGSWLLRLVHRSTRVWASAPSDPTRAAALWEKDRASRRLLGLLLSVVSLSVASQGKGGKAEGIVVPRRMRPPLPLRLRRLAGMKHGP